MKKLTTLFICLAFLAPAFSYAKLGVDEPVPVDECDNTGGFVATNFYLCQQLRSQIMALQIQLLTLQIQMLLKGSAGMPITVSRPDVAGVSAPTTTPKRVIDTCVHSHFRNERGGPNCDPVPQSYPQQ